MVVGDAISGSHGEVGDGSEGGDEGSQDVEQAFLLWQISTDAAPNLKDQNPYDWDTEGHHVKGEGREDHDHEDGPVEVSLESIA